MQKDKILILTQRQLHNGPRMIREINALIKDFDIDITGVSAPTHKKVTYIPFKNIERSLVNKVLGKIDRELSLSLPLSLTNSRLINKLEKLIKEGQYKVIITHSPVWLSILKLLKQKFQFKIVYNAHEYHPLEFTNNPKWLKTWGRYFKDIYQNDLPDADLMINVCESIRLKCKEDFGVDSIVVPNVADYNDCSPTPLGDKIRLIHHGSTIPGRNLEGMIEVAKILGDDYELHFMLNVVNEDYYKSLKELARSAQNVYFIDAVPFEDIVRTINAYDIGLYILPPTNFNNEIALPNKIFEFLQAKLCLAVGPSVEMKRIVQDYGVGVVSEDFTPAKMAQRITNLTREDILNYKESSVKTARTLNTESIYKTYRENLLLLLEK